MSRAFIAFGVLLALVACQNPFASDRAIDLSVSDVVVPEELAPGADLVVTLTVVTGGCRSFDRIDGSRVADRLTLIARGRDGTRMGGACPTDIRFEEHTYRAGPVSADPFTVVVRQPRESDLVRQIRVR